jgi:hypothetical protein
MVSAETPALHPPPSRRGAALDPEESLRAPLDPALPPILEPLVGRAPPPAPSTAGAASLLGLALMLGALVSLAWALTGQLVWEIAGFGVGACVVGLIARARTLATPAA